MRILVAEVDARSANFVTRALRSEGYYCVSTPSGDDALRLADEADFDLIIVEIMIQGLSGIEVCRRLRLRNNYTPLIMLTSLDSDEDMVSGLRAGADDYITKPFVIENLLARISAVLRRSTTLEEVQTSIRYKNIEFNTRSMRVVIAGEPVIFSAKELAILELFISHPEKLFSRERILSNVWGMHKDPLTNVVDVYVGKLRKKLVNADVVIETVRGLGYRLTPRKTKD